MEPVRDDEFYRQQSERILDAIPSDLTTRERCAMCHRYSPVGFHVPNEIWRASVHPHYSESILCIMCFAHGADERGVAWETGITLYPVSFATHQAGKQARQVGKKIKVKQGPRYIDGKR